MARRIHVQQVFVGELTLDEREAHHVRDVLRLNARTPVEVFDDAGNVGFGVLGVMSAGRVTVEVETLAVGEPLGFQLTIAAAVPKGARADWMVEKLSELGVDTFIPLATERSVSLPEGKNKLERWERLSEEAAKQSHRRGVMKIERLIPLPQAVDIAKQRGEAWCLSTSSGVVPIARQMTSLHSLQLTAFIGPEGGWTTAEDQLFSNAGIPPVSLTPTILRIETAAVATAAILLSLHDQ